MPDLQLSLTEERIVLLLAEGRSREIADVSFGQADRLGFERAGRKLERASALDKRVRGKKQ